MSEDYHIPTDFPWIDWIDEYSAEIIERIKERAYRIQNHPGDSAINEIQYDIAGKPYGDDERGLARFFVEQAIREEMEIIKQQNRNPNDMEPN